MKVSQNVQQHILEKLGNKVVESGENQGDFWITIEGKNILSVVSFLKDDPMAFFDQFIDICGVDYLKRKPRFESVLHLYSSKNKHRIRIRNLVDDQTLTLPSITNIWKGANWQERESFDMYGIKYEGHPNMSRILSPPGETNFPQRKDFPLKGARAIDEDLE